MRDFFDQIERASDLGVYYVALASVLIVPDLCGAMDAEDGRATRSRYVEWFDRFVAPRYEVRGESWLTGEDAYGLRCAMLHQGRLRPHIGRYSRVIFLEPGPGGPMMHNNVINDVLNIDVGTFVRDVLDGARAWLDEAEGTPRYVENYRSSMQRHADGLSPFIVGVPVIG